MAIVPNPHRPERLLTNEGPLLSEVRIIAVEFALRMPNGQEVELEMFSCSHTFTSDTGYYNWEARFTLHTSRGDRTIRQQLQF